MRESETSEVSGSTRNRESGVGGFGIVEPSTAAGLRFPRRICNQVALDTLKLSFEDGNVDASLVFFVCLLLVARFVVVLCCVFAFALALARASGITYVATGD